MLCTHTVRALTSVENNYLGSSTVTGTLNPCSDFSLTCQSAKPAYTIKSAACLLQLKHLFFTVNYCMNKGTIYIEKHHNGRQYLKSPTDLIV